VAIPLPPPPPPDGPDELLCQWALGIGQIAMVGGGGGPFLSLVYTWLSLLTNVFLHLINGDNYLRAALFKEMAVRK